MADWKSHLRADPTEWLLEGSNPSVRYFTLRRLLDDPDTDRGVEQARARIMQEGPVPRILAAQEPDGYWDRPLDFYERSKYHGTVWSLILLASLGADGRDPRVRAACEFILTYSQDSESGGFAYHGGPKGGDHSQVLPCLTGNMLWSLIRLGFANDPRVRRGINWITRYQRFDVGEGPAPRGWPYNCFAKCWGRHTCTLGVAKTLKALAEYHRVQPQSREKVQIEKTGQAAAEYLLAHHLYKGCHHPKRVPRREWKWLGFPRMWNSDALELLGLVVSLGYRDERMQDAVDLVLSKQDRHGRWKLENSLNGRMQVRIEREGEPSKWVTLQAMVALRGFFS